MKKNVMVLFGGKSVEHDISIITAMQIIRCVPEEYKVIPVYVQKSGAWCVAQNLRDIDVYMDFSNLVKKKKEVFLIPSKQCLYSKGKFSFNKIDKIDCALVCLHGGAGEDGSVAALLDMCNIPFTSSSHVSSAICMDKIFTKLVLSAKNILNVPYEHFYKDEYLEDKKSVVKKIREMGFPVILKPANLGSSVGIEVVKNDGELEDKIEKVIIFDKRILVEKFLEDAEEYNCACLQVEKEIISSKVVKVEKSDIFTFEEKYIEKAEKKPQKTKKMIEKQVSMLAKEVYKLLDCKGVVRIDFLMKDEKLYVNEINTIPGSLSISMFNNFSKKEFVDILIKEAKKNELEKNDFNLSFKSDAIKVFIDAVNDAKSQKY